MSSVDSITVTNTDPVNQITVTSSDGITVTTVGTQGLAGPSAIMTKGIETTAITSSGDGALLIYDHTNDKWTATTESAVSNLTVQIKKLRLGGANATVTAILDEDDMSSNSATSLVTQQSIKAYVDSQVTAQDLDISDGSSTIAIDLDSETLGLLGGTGVTSTASGNNVTFAIGQAVGTSSNVQFNQVTAALVGNASTATALATARTINGASFDGTANISFDSDSVSEGSSNLYFTAERVDDQVNTLLVAGTGISLSYDDSAGTLTINGQVGDITSVVAGNGLTGGGTSGDVTLAVSVDDSSIEINSDSLRVKASGITNAMLGGSIANDKLANSSITINSNATALGSSVTLDTDDIGEGSSNQYFTTTRANTAIDNRVTNTFINNLSGVVADTATALATGRTIALSGDVTASGVSFDGTSNITLSTTIAANSVALGTDTTGNYVATIADAGNSRITVANSGSETAAITLDIADDAIGTDQIANNAVSLGTQSTGNYVAGISGTTNEIEVSGSGSETASVTIGLPDNVTIAGNLTVNGTTTTVNTATLEVEDPLIKLAKANSGADSVDIGFYGLYDTSGSQDLYAGLFRDASDSGKFKLFKDLQAEPTTTVNTSGTGYAVGTLVSNLEGDVTGTLQTAAQPNITSVGTLSGLTVSGDAIFDTSTLKVDSSNNRIGIGTASPSFKLDLDTSSGSYQRITGSDQANVRLRFTNGGSGGKSYEIVGGLAGANNSAFSIFDVDNSATRLSIDSSGDVTIGGTLATTLSTAAQPNITSLGTLTTLTVDDITINGSTISDAANLTIDIGGELNIDVDGGAINYKDGGTHFGSIEKDGNNFRFESKISDGDIVFRGNDGGSGINALTLDMSNAGSATFNKDIFIGDGNPIRFGDDQDGRVFYDDTNGFIIQNSTSDKDILIKGNDGGSTITALTLDMSDAGKAIFTAGATFGNNVDITGTVTATELNVAEFQTSTNVFESNVSGHKGARLRAAVSDASTPTFSFHDDTNTGMYSSGADTLNFSTAGSEALRIDSSGNVGIGTSSPAQALEINGNFLLGNNQEIRFKDSSGTQRTALELDGSNNLNIGTSANGNLVFINGSSYTERMRIDSSGNVGIGLTNPSAYGKFTVQGTATQLALNASSGKARVGFFEAGTGRFYFDTLNGSDGLAFVDADGSTERMRIDSSGNLLIGNTVSNPVSGFSDQAGFGYASSTGQVQIATTGDNEALQIGKNNSNDGKILTIRKQSTVIGSIGSEGGDSLFIQGGSSSGSGLLMHGTGAKVLPLQNGNSVDATIDLGQSSRQFKNLYLSNAVYLNDIIAAGSGGLSLQTDEGTKRLIVTDAGNIGIGETSPDKQLHIKDSGTVGIVIESTDNAQNLDIDFYNNSGSAAGRIRYAEGSGNFAFMPNQSTESVVFSYDGKVGIGVSSPDVPLHVQTNDSTTNSTVTSLMITNLSTGTTTTGFGGEIRFQAERNNGVNQNTGGIRSIAEVNSGADISSGMAFDTGTAGVNSEKLRITHDGKVGIGINTPSQILNLKANTPFIQFNQDGTDSFAGINFGDDDDANDGQILYDHDSRYMRFQVANNERVRINSSGNVGIGTSSPAEKLHVVGDVRVDTDLYIQPTNKFYLDGGNDTFITEVSANDMAFNTAGAERMRIDSSGNLGIGTTSPSSTVDSHGAKGTTAGIPSGIINATDTTALAAGNGGAINFSGCYQTGGGKTAYASIEASKETATHNEYGAAMVFKTREDQGTQNEHMRVTSTGHVLLGTTTNQGVGGISFQHASSGVNIQQNSDSTSGGYEFYVFRRNSTQIGSINQSSTNAVTYNTSSDARLKDVTGSSRGLDVINNLNPVAYNWKADNHADEGLIAQEVEELVPNAVSQNEDGYYSMDYSKLVTHLVKGMQEQQEQIELLKSEISNLKEK